MFSIIIPLHNKELYIGRAIRSILAQTNQNFEILIIDDGSTDNSLIHASAFDDDRIRVIRQKNNGVSSARNRGIVESQLDIVAFLDADDEWLPDYLSSIGYLVEEYPSCSVFATSYLYRDGKYSMKPDIKFQGESGIIDNYFKLACDGSPPLWTSAVAIKKSALTAVGMFNENVKSGEDLVLWARLAQCHKIAYFNKAMSIYHFPITLKSELKIRIPDKKDLVFEELLDIYNSEKNNLVRKSIRRYIGHWCKIRLHIFSHNKMPCFAFRQYLKLIRYDPANIKGFLLLVLSISPLFIHKIAFSSKFNKMK